MSQDAEDRRPWDARLLERISRGSYKPQRKGSSPYAPIPHLVASGVTAVATGSLYWVGLTGIAAAMLLVGVYRSWHHRDRRSADAAPNPFGG